MRICSAVQSGSRFYSIASSDPNAFSPNCRLADPLIHILAPATTGTHNQHNMSASDSKDTPSTTATRRHRLSTSSSSHGQHSLLRGLNGLQTIPTSRQNSSKRSLIGSESFVKRMELQTPLKGHHGCVNTLAWDETGEFLLTGSGSSTLGEVEEKSTMCEYL